MSRQFCINDKRFSLSFPEHPIVLAKLVNKNTSVAKNKLYFVHLLCSYIYLPYIVRVLIVNEALQFAVLEKQFGSLFAYQ